MLIIDKEIQEIITAINRRHRILFEGEMHNGNGTYLYKGSIPPLEQEHSKKNLVVKILRTENKDIQKFFDQEASIYSHLNHKNIVRTEFTEKITTTHSKTSRFIVMEYIDGLNLHEIITRLSANDITIAPVIALFITKEVLEGLNYVHQKKDLTGSALNIVHGDISPDNIMISRQGEVKILDFGVARTNSKEVNQITGKYAYMAPEQREGKDLDQRTDLYATTIILGELLLTRQINSKTMNRLVSKDGIDPELGMILDKGLAKDPADRFQSAEEMIHTIENYMMQKNVIAQSSEIRKMMDQVLDDLGQQKTIIDTVGADSLLKENNAEINHSLLKNNLDHETFFKPDSQASPIAKFFPFILAITLSFLIIGVLYNYVSGRIAAMKSDTSDQTNNSKYSLIKSNDLSLNGTPLTGTSSTQDFSIQSPWKSSINITSPNGLLVLTNGDEKWSHSNELNLEGNTTNSNQTFGLLVSSPGFKNKLINFTLSPSNPTYTNNVVLEKAGVGHLELRADPPSTQITIPGFVVNRETPFSVTLPEGFHDVIARLYNEDEKKWHIQKTIINIQPNGSHKCIAEFWDKHYIKCK